jgi:hypothetical protein
MKARIKYVLAPKSDTQGEVWVNLVLENNNIQKAPLGIFALFSQWDPLQERVLGADEETKEQNTRLDLLKGYLEVTDLSTLVFFFKIGIKKLVKTNTLFSSKYSGLAFRNTIFLKCF